MAVHPDLQPIIDAADGFTSATNALLESQRLDIAQLVLERDYLKASRDRWRWQWWVILSLGFSAGVALGYSLK